MKKPKVCCSFYGQVGVSNLKNDLQTVQYPTLKKNKRKQNQNGVQTLEVSKSLIFWRYQIDCSLFSLTLNFTSLLH